MLRNRFRNSHLKFHYFSEKGVSEKQISMTYAEKNPKKVESRNKEGVNHLLNSSSAIQPHDLVDPDERDFCRVTVSVPQLQIQSH